MPRPTAPPPQDYVEIQNLYGYYNLSSDAGDAEAYAGCFTDDGVLTINHLNFTVKGRADLIAFKEKDKAGRAGRYRRHWNGSIFLEKVDERTVRGRCYLHGFNGMPGSLPELADVGAYEDLIVKVGGEWRFASRTIMMDGSRWQPPAMGSVR
jgi:SnoaL-like protein